MLTSQDQIDQLVEMIAASLNLTVDEVRDDLVGLGKYPIHVRLDLTSEVYMSYLTRSW